MILSLHNVNFYQEFMYKIRQSIKNGNFDRFYKENINKYKLGKEEQQNIQNYIFYNKKKKNKTNKNKKGERKKICHLQYQHKCVAL